MNILRKKTFLDFVEQEESPWLVGNYVKKEKLRCHNCYNSQIELEATYKSQNENHWWFNYRCVCGYRFTVEFDVANNNAWLTDPEGLVLVGLPSTYQRYLYTHKHCGGSVEREYLDSEGEKLVFMSCWERDKFQDPKLSKWKTKFYNLFRIKHFDVVFKCKKCGEHTLSSIEYFKQK